MHLAIFFYGSWVLGVFFCFLRLAFSHVRLDQPSSLEYYLTVIISCEAPYNFASYWLTFFTLPFIVTAQINPTQNSWIDNFIICYPPANFTKLPQQNLFNHFKGILFETFSGFPPTRFRPPPLSNFYQLGVAQLSSRTQMAQYLGQFLSNLTQILCKIYLNTAPKKYSQMLCLLPQPSQAQAQGGYALLLVFISPTHKKI